MRIHRVALSITACLVVGALLPTPSSRVGTTAARPQQHEVAALGAGAPPDSMVDYGVSVEAFWRYVEGQVANEEAIAAAARAAATPPPVPAAAPAAPVAADGEIPPAWLATAICEEGGRDDPNYGYFGIQEWDDVPAWPNGYEGYPTAGSAPIAVQLAWEAANGQGPPDAPGQCHSY